MENFNIKSLHGQYFTAEICFNQCYGRISVNEHGMAYLCQNEIDGGSKDCRDFFGYTYGFYVGKMEKISSAIQDLKTLPPPTAYHALFQEILEKRGPAWDEDGSYSVVPNEVMASIVDFMSEIKVFEPKNLGNNQNQ